MPKSRRASQSRVAVEARQYCRGLRIRPRDVWDLPQTNVILLVMNVLIGISFFNSDLGSHRHQGVAILRSMLPNNRLVTWLSASSSQ